MTSIHKDIDVAASADQAWEALRDYGAVHERVVPGFVTDSRLQGNDRVLTFVTGAVATERLVAIDEERRRLVYSVVDGPFELTHHQASVEVIEPRGGDGGCRVVWTTDVLPDAYGPVIDELMEMGAEAMTRGLR